MTQTPFRPTFQVEGPATACVLHGQLLGWANCTCLSTAMGIDRATLGDIRLSGCQVRDETGDYVGGTTIEQNAAVAATHGVKVDIHTGPNVGSPYLLAVSLQAGRGASVAGNTQPDGRGNVNHNVWVNEALGGTLGHPASVLVYDPWSTGPTWWTWAKLLAFGAALHPWGEADPRTLKSLGISGLYCGIYPDTEPHFFSKFGGVATNPYPDVTTGKAGTTDAQRRLRGGPGFEYKPAGPKLLPVGGQFTAYQTVANAQGRWYGNVDGSLWINGSGLSGLGVRP